MPRGISGGNQVIKFASTNNHSRACYSLKTGRRFTIASHAKCTIGVSTSFVSLLLSLRTSTVAYIAFLKVTMITSSHNLLLSSLR